MSFAAWCSFAGLILINMALVATLVHRLPLSSSMLYLAIGAAVSPLGLGLIEFEPLGQALLLERLAEVVVVLSLFTSGLKMGAGFGDGRWRPPVRLAVLSMLITVALVAAVAHLLLGLPIGAAVLLGGVLAPTDPVLAAEVQVAHAGDRDRLRFSLTGEAGMNDGTAFPVIMLGLGLMGLHEIGPMGWRWFAVDVLWAVAAGLGIGAGVGWAIGRLVLYLRRVHREAVGLDEFLALGVVALSYGLALQCVAYGFLAVFAAGVVLRQVERHESADRQPPASDADPDEAMRRLDVQAARSAATEPSKPNDESPGTAEEAAVHPTEAPAFMAHAMLHFNEQLERIGEVVAVVVVGMLLWTIEWQPAIYFFIAITLLLIRPVAVALGLLGSRSDRINRALIGWFGIRGIGSLYYLMYAVNHGVPTEIAADLTAVTLAVVTVSIVVHGVSVKPLIAGYERMRKRRSSKR